MKDWKSIHIPQAPPLMFHSFLPRLLRVLVLLHHLPALDPQPFYLVGTSQLPLPQFHTQTLISHFQKNLQDAEMTLRMTCEGCLSVPTAVIQRKLRFNMIRTKWTGDIRS